MAQGAVTESTQSSELPDYMTYEEFLEWADEDTWAEWVDGRVEFLSPVSPRHQAVAGWLLCLFRLFVEAHDLGEVFMAPMQMKTGPKLSGREPDVTFVAKENLQRLERSHLKGPADLVVEVVSPDSRTRDRRDKYREYQAGGVREYWVVDPDRQTAEFHLLGEDGLFHPAASEQGIYRSTALPGLWLQVEWLWEEQLPLLLDVLREWGLV